MTSPDTRSTTLTDPHLSPENVRFTDGGLVASGPHGEEFKLTEQQTSIVAGIIDGTLPSYQHQVKQLIQLSTTAELHHP